ncbi:C39 family peptidase [Cohnella thailandensis]|uniref:C39 family peptidase n=1 Tax=Cohnella thailandensis TaxID=557557 RepID=A0A841SM71_9BACL|nr:C39 family peptidase [Cohnella thailandensis]MBB6633573.1 C39 family peptidase [Cohnella thailandensis]MBP1974592.1 hypothetical protein [Cohnella thailandensis]
MAKVYYSQEDLRWKNTPYTNRNDPTQTIGTSACGPTCFAMAASSLLGKSILPTEAAKFAVDNDFRTDDQGTKWTYFAAAAKKYGLACEQTGTMETVKAALATGALVVASMRSGHFTAGGHYILLVGIGGGWFDVYDPNQDNRKYGSDGLIDQGVKDDGKVRAKESVIRNEARQFWIINKPVIEEEEQPMIAAEKNEFEELTSRVEALEKKIEAPAWFLKEFGSGNLNGLISEPKFTSEGWRVLSVALRAIKK